jgi:hypothetical protein
MAHQGDQNLNRGNIRNPNLAPKWEKGQSGNPGGGIKQFHEENAKIADKVMQDGDASLELIHVSLTQLTANLLKRAARERSKVPDRAVMDVVREFRQTQEAVNEARKARGALAEVDDLFARLDARLEEVTARLEESVRPAVALAP